ncbi:hypothetical protein [Brevibacillus porteri]|uniref:hypothetical protein n=1 Tax=Brevibacillus porteri TaxID=2126350 RepID=UPI003D221E92
MKKQHKKPPIRNNATVIPVKASDFHKAAEEAVKRAEWLMEQALREEFGFGDTRMQRLRSKVDELAKHKSFEAWVDYSLKVKVQA